MLNLKQTIIRIISLPYLLLWYLSGWRVEQDLPDLDKFVIIGAPHTSNWDFVHVLGFASYTQRYPNVTMKHSLFEIPVLGWFLRAVGGIPIERGASKNIVQQFVEMLGSRDRIILIFTPEGTRGKKQKADYWKTGFYYTALQANVPIVGAYVDYARKRTGAAVILHPTGDIRSDMDKIRAFYSTHGYPKHPERQSTIQLQEEIVT